MGEKTETSCWSIVWAAGALLEILLGTATCFRRRSHRIACSNTASFGRNAAHFEFCWKNCEAPPRDDSLLGAIRCGRSIRTVLLCFFPRYWLRPKKGSVESMSYPRCATVLSDPMILMATETSTMGGRTSTSSLFSKDMEPSVDRGGEGGHHNGRGTAGYPQSAPSEGRFRQTWLHRQVPAVFGDS